MYIYLAGAISQYFQIHEASKSTEWRKDLINFCKDNNIKFFDPTEAFFIEKNHDYDVKMPVAQNKYYLDKCDIVVVNLEYILQSPGSIWELCYSSEIRKIPVIAFGKNPKHPHILNCITQIVDGIEDVKELLANMFDI